MRRRLEPFVGCGLTLAALLLVGLPPAGAQPFSREELPPALRPWVPWVLDQAPTLGCATVQGQAYPNSRCSMRWAGPEFLLL